VSGAPKAIEDIQLLQELFFISHFSICILINSSISTFAYIVIDKKTINYYFLISQI